MRLLTKSRSSRFRSLGKGDPLRQAVEPARGGKLSPEAVCRGLRPQERGYVLLLVMMAAAILLISLTAALPSIYTQSQREKEKELIFRGTEYARAVYLFHQQFHRYPTTVKEMLHTNDMSFLRRAYRDPMARNGKWRFIHATANGVIIDSEDIKVANPSKPGENSSSQQSKGGSSSSSNSSGGDQGQQPAQGSQQNSSPSGAGQQGQSPGSPANSNPFGQGQETGAYIVGVASTSHAASIMVYDRHTQYNKWEFIGIPGVPGSVIQPPVSIPGVTPQPEPGSTNSTPSSAAPPNSNSSGNGSAAQ